MFQIRFFELIVLDYVMDCDLDQIKNSQDSRIG